MKYALTAIGGLASQYLGQAFIRWDLSWVLKIGDWSKDERGGLLALCLFSIFLAAIGTFLFGAEQS
jgi:hypothetical protein